MADAVPIRRALLSVSDKSGVLEFAMGLADRGVTIISTGGTASALRAGGIDVTSVEDVTGFPEMLDGRVKTLHPAIHGGLLAVRDDTAHTASIDEAGIAPIDLICIFLYPFEETVASDGASDEEIIEQIDIGGPAMIRSAAKNHRFVTVVTDPSQYQQVLTDMDANDGGTTMETRRSLANAAFTRTASYDNAIKEWMVGGGERLRIDAPIAAELRYGENPDQVAAVFSDGSGGVVRARSIEGKPLSFNNLADADAALAIVTDLDALDERCAAAVIKHANPCGAALGGSLTEALELALLGDPQAAFGGIVAIGGHVDAELASAIAGDDRFLEVIIAMDFDEDATAVLLGQWKGVRLLSVGQSSQQPRRQVRSIGGGWLVQDLPPVCCDAASWEVMAGEAPDEALLAEAAFAWVAAAHLKSNAIAITSGASMIGAGMGQVDRVSAARHAIERAGERLGGDAPIVAASDAFFPFPDGPALLADAGVNCIVQPGGSIRDNETIDLCATHGITLLHTGQRRFRH